ncbi:MAG: GNAT family N-acetyltransferase [Sciscionella sp.]|nr:GNAT family N-acetyltransferase [Sciscionella sp.]
MTDFEHPDAAKLLADAQQELARRYGSEDETPMDADEFTPPNGMLLVGYHDDEPVACGGWRARDGDGPGLREGDAEIKRMFVMESARGNGFARALLAELERTAAATGRHRMVLETGLAQPEAIALYTSAGYTEVEKFGHYRCNDLSRCYAKPL